MPDWAIVLVAAFGGGLAGAVLQPAVTHALEGIRSKREIRCRRERTLRRMLEARLVDGGRLAFAALDLHIRLQRGVAVASEERFQLAKGPGGLPLWQPERIADPELRQVADEYQEVCLSLAQSVLTAAQEWDPRPAAARIMELQRRITSRMDELNWPEVDD